MMQSTIPALHSIDDPLITITYSSRLKVRRVASVIGFGQAKSQTLGAIQEPRHPLFLLFFGAEIAHHEHCREVAHN